MDKIELKVHKHPKPYTLQRLSEEGEMRLTHQVDISFTIVRYKDMVECDVLPMETSHILFGRPAQYEKKAVHDGFTNRHFCA